MASPRSTLASVIGWVIVAVILFWGFGLVIGWIRFVIRSMFWLVLIGVLVVIYLNLKAPDDT